MADLTKGITFTEGQQVTHTDLNNIVDLATITAGVIVDADVNASAAIGLSKLDSTDAMNAASYQVSATEVIDSSRNLTNIAAATMTGLTTTNTLQVNSTSTLTGSVTCSGSLSALNLSVTGAVAQFTGASLQLHAAAIALGENSGDTLTMNGTFDGAPTIASATFASGSDKVLFTDTDDSGNIKVGTLTIPSISSTTKAITGVAVHEITHGLGAEPSWLRVVLERTAAGYDTQFGSGTDFPIAQGEEVDIETLFYPSGSWPAFRVKCDDTKIYISPTTTVPQTIVDGNNHALSDITTNYQLKVYYGA